MTIGKASGKKEPAGGNRPQERLGDDALRTGLSIILADAARSHLEAGNLDKATRCVAEAERCLAFLSSPQTV